MMLNYCAAPKLNLNYPVVPKIDNKLLHDRLKRHWTDALVCEQSNLLRTMVQKHAKLMHATVCKCFILTRATVHKDNELHQDVCDDANLRPGVPGTTQSNFNADWNDTKRGRLVRTY